MDLLDTEIHFKVKISSINGMPAESSNVFCEYKFEMDDIKYSTDVVNGDCDFLYEKLHHVKSVTKQWIDYLIEGHLTVKVFGTMATSQKEKDKFFDNLKRSTQKND